MSLLEYLLGVVLGATTLCVSVSAVRFIRWRWARRRSRINSLAHQLEGPYRKRGQKRRK